MGAGGRAALLAAALLLAGCGGSTAASGATERLDVPYDAAAPGDPNRTLDAYLPPGPSAAPRPVVVWVHGGAWFTGDKRNAIADKVALFAREGYVLVAVNYRLSPVPSASPAPDRIRYPIHPQDVARAVAWVREHAAELGADPLRIALLGHSAGAHVVALVAADPGLLGAHGLGPSDLRCTASLDTEGYDVAAELAGPQTAEQRAIYLNAFGEEPALWAAASPLAHVAPGAGIGPFLLASRGTAERRAGMEAFRAALAAAGVGAEVIDASSLTHEEVNTRIGAPGDAVVTPPLVAFLAGCFR